MKPIINECNFLKFFLKFTPLFISLVYLTSQAQTNSGRIEGYIFNKKNNPIANVNVIVENTNLADVSDANGYFSLEEITPGYYTIIFKDIRFHSKNIQNVGVFSNQTTNIDTIVLKERIFNSRKIVVTATRSADTLNNIPQQINSVSAEQIKKRNSKTSAEALQEELGISVQKTNHGGGSAIIRGLSSNQILILVDGIRLNNSTYRLGNHQYLTTVDNLMARRIEVVRGPTSVLYGSDALGGTINILTKKPEFIESEEELNYRIFGRYATADAERTTRTEVSYGFENFALQAGFSFKEYGDLKRGKNSDENKLEKSTDGIKQSPSGFKAYDFDTKLIYAINTNQSICLSYQLSRQKDVPRYDKYENDNYFKWLYQPQNRNLIYLTYENRFISKFINSLKTSISFHRQKEGRQIQKTDTSQLTIEEDDVQTIGFIAEVKKDYKSHNYTLGTEVYLDRVKSEKVFEHPNTGNTTKALRGKYPDRATYNSFGVFLQDEIDINSKWKIIPGIRFTYINTNFQLLSDTGITVNREDISYNFKSLTGSISGLFKINPNIRLKANIAQAFRAPNLSDFSKFGESKGNVFEVPNKKLEPEKMLSFDFGCDINYSNLYAQASIYYSKMWDMIASANVINSEFYSNVIDSGYIIKSKKNIGRAYIHGFEAALEYKFLTNFSFNTKFTSTFGQNLTLDEPVGTIPPMNGLIGFEFENENYYFDVYARFAGNQNRLSSDDIDDPRIPLGGTPGWQTYNFRAGYKLKNLAEIQFSVENILDHNYREHGSGINGPGRNFILSLELKN